LPGSWLPPSATLHDEILLCIPVLALLGTDAVNAAHAASIAALSLLVVSVVFVYWTPLHMQLESLFLLTSLLLLRSGMGDAMQRKTQTAGFPVRRESAASRLSR
jgi:hypothetical protein